MHKNWMQHNNESKESLRKLWKHSEDYKSGYEPNVEKGLTQLKARIAKDKQVSSTAKVISISRKQWLSRIAAAITLLITFSFLFNLLLNNSADIQQVATTDELLENIILPDGSTVWLNKRSTFSFPKTFSETKRVVTLDGEAFFKVTKNPNKPFIVQTPEGVVKVLGTEFNVRAYQNEGSTIVEVEQGSVLFTVPNVQEEKLLRASDKVVFDRTNATFSEIEPLKWKDTAWKTKQLDFVNQPIAEVLAYLKENFEVRVDYAAEKIANCPFNSTLVTNKPEAILKQLESAFPLIHLKKINLKQYQLSGNCN